MNTLQLNSVPIRKHWWQYSHTVDVPIVPTSTSSLLQALHLNTLLWISISSICKWAAAAAALKTIRWERTQCYQSSTSTAHYKCAGDSLTIIFSGFKCISCRRYWWEVGGGFGGDMGIKVNLMVRHTDANNTNKPDNVYTMMQIWSGFTPIKFDSWSNVRKKNVTLRWCAAPRLPLRVCSMFDVVSAAAFGASSILRKSSSTVIMMCI